jgi:type II secretory pathway pseudopilin PulG
MADRTNTRRGRRPAFTLVEMMVSTALILFMMYILAGAFEKGLESFRVLKKAGDMQERLRAATTIIRQDLTRDHFGKHMLLSDQRLDQFTWRLPADPNGNDGGGYFRLYQHDGTATQEGSDPDDPGPLPNGVYYTRSTNHILQFTVRLQPDDYRRDLFFSADTKINYPNTATADPQRLCDYSVPDYMRPSYAPRPANESPTSVYASRWAEVTYYLQPVVGQTASATQLYGLYRRQKLLVENAQGPTVSNPNPTPNPNGLTGDPTYLQDMSVWKDKTLALRYNDPKGITVPGRRFLDPFPTYIATTDASLNGTNPNWNAVNRSWIVGGYPVGPSTPPQPQLGIMAATSAGGDLLLSDVICFEVKALWDIPTDTTRFTVSNGVTLATPQPIWPPQMTNNPDWPFDLLPVGGNPYFNTPPTPPYANNTHLRVFDTWSQSPPDTANDGYDFLGVSANNEDPTWRIGSTKTKFSSGTELAEDRQPTVATIPLRVRLRAVQIKLRIWDVKSQTSRQITVIQDL